MTQPSEVAICNLLYRYAELIDAGRFEDIMTELFADARFVIGPEGTPEVDATAMLEILCRTTIRYPEGTPRTRHIVSNPIVDVDEAAGTATCRSCYTVFQQTDTLPLQPIVAGRYHDCFERVDGTWRFSRRDYTLVDLVGDTSQHLRYPLEPIAP
jgi:3-phenylpropionate/cinnamic acid dioxygenase small subunit